MANYSFTTIRTPKWNFIWGSSVLHVSGSFDDAIKELTPRLLEMPDLAVAQLRLLEGGRGQCMEFDLDTAQWRRRK